MREGTLQVGASTRRKKIERKGRAKEERGKRKEERGKRREPAVITPA